MLGETKHRSLQGEGGRREWDSGKSDGAVFNNRLKGGYSRVGGVSAGDHFLMCEVKKNYFLQTEADVCKAVYIWMKNSV